MRIISVIQPAGTKRQQHEDFFMLLMLNFNFFIFSLSRDHISVVICACVLPFINKHRVDLSFCINSKQFISELCTPGDREVLNQHVPLD